jgi:CHAT domain-containing protein
MAALPLHAAGMYRSDGSASECASDYMVSSYIPTISALKAARAGYQPVRRDKLTAVLVAEANAPGFQLIGSVRDESRIIRALLQAASVPVLNDMDTTFGPQDIIKHLPDAALVHMATHGEQTDNPLRSRFALRDGNLTIADLLRLRLPHAVLAFLSACETARGSDVQPDQVLHLATSMLFCGFRTVIATLW